MSRLLWTIAFVVCLVIAGLALLFWLFQHWIAIHTGTVYLMCGTAACPEQPYYNAFSGSVSDISEITLPITLFGAIFALYKIHFECHNAPCHKPFAMTTTDGHKLCHGCKVKHPDELHLVEAHSAHLP